MRGARAFGLNRQGSTAPYTVDDPFDLPWVVAAWASDPSWTPPSDGAVVDTWRDGSGNGRDLTATSTRRPIYRASHAHYNSHPVIEFDGSNDYIVTTTGVWTQAVPFSVVIIGEFLTGDSGSRYLAGWVNGFSWVLGSSAGGKLSLSNGVNISDGDADYDTPHLYTGVLNGASSDLLVDGTSVVTGDTGSEDADMLSVGSRQSAGEAKCLIAFAGLIAGDITAHPGWAAFKTWAASYYALTIT